MTTTTRHPARIFAPGDRVRSGFTTGTTRRATVLAFTEEGSGDDTLAVEVDGEGPTVERAGNWRKDPTGPTRDQAVAWLHAESALAQAVADLNRALGKADAPSAERVTTGYIGNDDDVLYMVFLPHPGRYGTAADRLGVPYARFDVTGSRKARALVDAATRGARLALASVGR